MFGLSFTEIIVVMVISFLIFGPEQFPIMVKKAVQNISAFKKYIAQAQNSFTDFTRDVEKEFDPTQWAEDSNNSVAQGYHDEQNSSATILVEELSTNPNDYEITPLTQWRWQAQVQSKPGDFESEPFDWKAKTESAN